MATAETLKRCRRRNIASHQTPDYARSRHLQRELFHHANLGLQTAKGMKMIKNDFEKAKNQLKTCLVSKLHSPLRESRFSEAVRAVLKDNNLAVS